MAQKEILLNAVKNSKWQPNFHYTNDLDAVVNSICEPHEDRMLLGIRDKVKEIIVREVDYHNNNLKNPFTITFADVCNWQKELFNHKLELINESDDEKILNLPNQYINLGLRQTNVTVGEDTPPNPIFLEEIKELCFPIHLNYEMRERLSEDYSWQIVTEEISLTSIERNFEANLLTNLTEWYKTFEHIHFFEDLNGRLGGIVINILSFLLCEKFMIKPAYPLDYQLKHNNLVVKFGDKYTKGFPDDYIYQEEYEPETKEVLGHDFYCSGEYREGQVYYYDENDNLLVIEYWKGEDYDHCEFTSKGIEFCKQYYLLFINTLLNDINA